MRERISATLVLIITLQSAMDIEEPTMRNSNFLPVKAKGDVRLRSEMSLGRVGMVATPMRRLPP